MTPDDDRRNEQTTMVHEVPIPPSAVTRTKKPFVLEQIGGTGAPREHALELSEVIVGRSLQATVPVDGSGISRQHLALRRSGPEYVLTDLGSANGVYLNGVKTHSATLREGDTIQIGDAVFVYHEGA